MKLKLLIAILILLSTELFSQETGSHRGLIRMGATFGTGYLTKVKNTEIFLHTDLEYFLDTAISLRSDSYIYIDEMGEKDLFKFNHSLFTGALYHFKSRSQFDPYIGLQPGISYTQFEKIECNVLIYPLPNSCRESVASYNPLMSAIVGFNYYAPKIFHLFMNARYVTGSHLSDTRTPRALNEIRFSFGLGLQFN